jgi:hypothetical protein
MNSHVRDCWVKGYEKIIPSLKLPDPGDRQVPADAVQTKADVIVTFNLRDFPAAVLEKFGITAKHPDEFLVELFEVELFETDAENISLVFERH